MKYQELILALQKFWSDKGCVIGETLKKVRGQ